MTAHRKTLSAPTKAILLGATCLAGLVASQARAQTAAATSKNEVEEVVVTGFRRSLQEATNAKRDATTIQDSIFAEDIGKFPDTNLAESLNRVPGVQLTRETTGEGLNVAIRGLGTNFTKVLLNGNQIAVASTGRTDSQNQNREVDLDVFPTELFSRLDVNKTPVAGMLEGGVSGTVNLRSARPFDTPGQHLTYSLQGNYNTNSKDWTPRGSLIGSKTFDTGYGQFGVLAGLAVARAKVLTRGFETIGWTNANLSCTGCNTNGGNGFNFATTVPANAGNSLVAGTPVDAALLQSLNPGTSLVQLSDALVPRLGRPAYSEGKRDRYNALLSFEYRPSETLNFYLDLLAGRTIHKFNRIDMDWAVRNSNGMVPVGVKVDANNVATAGTFLNSQFFLEARPYHEKLNFFNANPGFTWQVRDWIRLNGQLNMSKSQFLRESPSILINTPLGTGLTVTYDNSGGVFPTISANRDLNDPNLGWTWAGGRVNIQNEHRVTKTKGAHFDGVFGDEDGANLKAGVAWDDARRSIIAYDNSPAWQQFVCGGGGTFQPAPAPQPACAGQAGSAVTQAQLASFLRPGPGGFISIDYPSFLQATNYSQFASTAPFSGASNTSARSGVIDEKTKGAFAEFNGKTEIHGMELRFNGGVRYVSTDQSITGPFTPPGASAPTGFQTLKSRYDAYLPSFNAVLKVRPDINLRLAASRTLTRPDPSQMLPGTSFSDPSAQTASQGNANLTPFKSDNFDIGAEWYTGKEGYVGIVGFQKEITGFTVNGTNTIPFAQLGVPFAALTPNQQQAINNRGGPSVATVTVQQQVNANGTLTIRGYEANWVQPLSFLLDGLGFTANYTRIYQSASGTGISPVAIGVSPYTYNITGYYDHGPASIRVSYVYNDKQISSTPNQNSVPVAQLRTDASKQWDLSASYSLDFLPSSPRVTLDVINITNEAQRQTFEYSNAAFTYYKPGRTFLVGVHGRF
ncbi:MAG: TonB-dependent receptor [Caulobacterales bacterium]|nr:TonB-dependent receptor [Caulobacterales bacterium]